MPHAADFWEHPAKVMVKFASTTRATIAIQLMVGLIVSAFASRVRPHVVEGLPGSNALAASIHVSTIQAIAVILRKVAQIALGSVFVAQFTPETPVRIRRVQHVVASSEPHVKALVKSASIIQTTIAIRSMVGPIALESVSINARLENAHQCQPSNQLVQDLQARPAVVLRESLVKVSAKSVSTTQVTTVTRSTVGPIASESASPHPHHRAEDSPENLVQASNGFALTTLTTAAIPIMVGLTARVFVFPALRDPHVVVSRETLAQARTTSASTTLGIIVIQRRAEVTALAFVFRSNSLLVHAAIVRKRSITSDKHELLGIRTGNLPQWTVGIIGCTCTSSSVIVTLDCLMSFV